MSTFTLAHTSYTNTVVHTDDFQNATNVVIAEGYTIIGGYGAFNPDYNSTISNVTSVTIPTSVTRINSEAFAKCPNLREVIFVSGSTLNFIDDRAFYDCRNLTSFSIPDSVTSIGTSIAHLYGAFGSCVKLESVTYGSNPTLKFIGGNSFINAKLNQVTIPTSVTLIGNNAFRSSNTGIITPLEISLSANLITIGTGAFALPVSKFTIDPNNTKFTVTDEAILYTNGTSTTMLAVASDNQSVTSIAVPDSVTSIGASLFENNTNVQNITFTSGSTLSSIGNNAFSRSVIQTITLPSTLNYIGDNAFYFNTSLTEVIFSPNSIITTINSNMCSQCHALTRCVIPASVTEIQTEAFSFTALSSLEFEENSNIQKLRKHAYRNCTQLTKLTIPSSLTEVSLVNSGNSDPVSDVFADQNGNSVVTELNIFSSGNNTLRPIIKSLLALKDVYFNFDGAIPSGIFSGIASVTKVTIGDEIKTLGNNVFSDTIIEEVIFEENSTLDVIGAGAFEGCSRLPEIFIPDTCSSIGQAAFKNCVLLTNIRIPPLIDIIKTETFFRCYGLINIIIPNTVTIIQESAFNGCNITNISFSDESLLTSIGEFAFAYMPITTITIPNNVTNIASNAFTSSDPQTLNRVEFYDPATVSNLDLQGGNLSTGYTVTSGFFGATTNEITFQYPLALITALTPTCFPKGTRITTNQGNIAIEQLNPDIHTIRGKSIVAITQSRPVQQYIVSIEKDALGKNVPCVTTQISKEHKVFYKGKMVKAKDLSGMCEGITKIPYNGETLYNVVLSKHDNMMVNNLICETLHPNNIQAKICGGKYSFIEQVKLCNELNSIIKTDNVTAYKKLYASLKI